MQVFICYSRADKQFAMQLVDDLSEYEIEVWMDVRSIPTGSNWDLEVQKGLDHSDAMLVLLSPDSSASQNVADEWSYFIERNKPIVPIMVAPCEVPFRLSRRQRVDFTVDYKVGFQQLIKALGSPALRDPESTQQVRPVPQRQPATASVAKVAAPAPAKQAQKPVMQAPPVAPEIGIKTYPMIWADTYHWFNGMGSQATQGDVMISPREIQLVPHAKPIHTIPLRSLVSASIQRSVDQHLKITYYGQDGSFQSLVLMGAPKENRKEITLQVLNLLKLLTGRSLT
jgi:hypothetical protein